MNYCTPEEKQLLNDLLNNTTQNCILVIIIFSLYSYPASNKMFNLLKSAFSIRKTSHKWFSYILLV